MIKLDKSSLPKSLWMLYYKCILSDGGGIEIYLDHDVSGKSQPLGNNTLTVYVEDVLQVSKLEPVSWACIVVYVWYLYQRMKEKNKLNKFRFMHPYNVGYSATTRTDKEYEDAELERRARALADRLGEIFPDEILLVPCNIGWHWILTVIDLKKEIVYLLDPLGPHNCSGDWKHVVET